MLKIIKLIFTLIFGEFFRVNIDTIMNFISQIPSIAWYAVPFMIVITILVFFHELGHYLTARWNGVGVDVFSIGFGPKLFGWHDSKGTHWKICLIPLGGYVKMHGDADASSKPDWEKIKSVKNKDTLHATKKPWQRMLIAAAGPIANFILTICLFVFLFSYSGQKSTEPIIGEVTVGSVAARDGLQVGDRILSLEKVEKSGEVADPAIKTFSDAQVFTNKHPGIPLLVKVLRGNQKLIFTLTPESKDVGAGKPVGVLGIAPTIIPHTFSSAVPAAFTFTWDLSVRTVKALGAMFTDREASKQLGGLFSIAKVAHDYAAKGWIYLLEIMAILSLNLGILNLFPVPVLDGGHVFLYMIEIIRGKPVSEKVQDFAFKVGFVLLIGLMLYAHFNDIMKFNFIGSLKNLFN